MFGLTEYIAAGAVVAAVSWGGIQTIRAQNMELKLERAVTAEQVALGKLANCANRLTNIQEAAESNASIPDDLTDFDIPAEWMRGSEGDPAPGSD